MKGFTRAWRPMLHILTLGDRWLLLFLLLGSFATLYQFIPAGHGAHTARIIHKGQVLLDLDLKTDQRVTISGERGPVIVEVKNHAIRIIESDCQNHFCVKSGAISKHNQIIVCVPNRIVIRILDKPGLDAITG
jgi:hypothetical protein